LRLSRRSLPRACPGRDITANRSKPSRRDVDYYPGSAYPQYRTELSFLDGIGIVGKKTPIFHGREAGLLLKRSAEMALIGKTEMKRQVAQGLIGVRQHLASQFDAPQTDEFADADAEVPLETGCKVGRMNADIGGDLPERRCVNMSMLRERGSCQIAGEIDTEVR
jgi:hypothetical protein